MSWWQFWESMRWDVPKVVLAVMLVVFLWSFYTVSRRKDFDFADIYKDDKDKVSLARVMSFGTWVVATWVVMQDSLDAAPTVEIFIAYMLIFSGVKVAEKYIEARTGK